MKKILITGSAGFIGYHTSLFFLKKNYHVIGLDNINSYYDVNLKKTRIKILKKYKKFFFYKVDLKNKKELNQIFQNNNIQIVINLAAQAGVRNSIKKPKLYLQSNIIGFFNLIELVREYKIKKFIFASTSSVYGNQSVNKFE